MGLTLNWPCTPQPPPTPTTENSMSAIFQLLLVRFWPNFKKKLQKQIFCHKKYSLKNNFTKKIFAKKMFAKRKNFTKKKILPFWACRFNSQKQNNPRDLELRWNWLSIKYLGQPCFLKQTFVRKKLWQLDTYILAHFNLFQWLSPLPQDPKTDPILERLAPPKKAF